MTALHSGLAEERLGTIRLKLLFARMARTCSPKDLKGP